MIEYCFASTSRNCCNACPLFSWPPFWVRFLVAGRCHQTAPNAAGACPVVAALGIHSGLAAVVGDRLDIAGPAGGLRSCTALVLSCVACRLGPYLVAWEAQRYEIPRVSRRQIHRPRHSSPRVRVHLSRPLGVVSKHCRWLVVGMTYLDEVLAFWLGDERLELWGGEGVDEASL